MTAIPPESTIVDDSFKGVPWGTVPFEIGKAGTHGWNLLSEDLPLPLAVLKQSAIDNNSAWMKQFMASTPAVLAPHGKTTMSPQLFQRQLDDGAWAITLANAAQMQIARRYGIQRIILANQLVGRQALDFVFGEMRDDPEFDFYCLVDSVEGVSLLAEAAKKASVGRPLQVLLEGGVVGGRTGVRTLEPALEIAQAVADAAPYLTLRGVEGFEGVVHGKTAEDTRDGVVRFLTFLENIARRCDEKGLFGPETVILSAGGSAFYDVVAKIFGATELSSETLIVIRSGCYLTHDSIMYEAFLQDMVSRSDKAAQWGPKPQAALEVWAYVQSRPEPGRVILTLGKRDASYDAGLPKPLSWVRPGTPDRRLTGTPTAPLGGPLALGSDHVTVEVNDQHLFMDVPENSPLAVGDMVGFGISHPCLTFDKWQFIPIVDDDYNVVSAVRTFF